MIRSVGGSVDTTGRGHSLCLRGRALSDSSRREPQMIPQTTPAPAMAPATRQPTWAMAAIAGGAVALCALGLSVGRGRGGPAPAAAAVAGGDAALRTAVREGVRAELQELAKPFRS